MQHSNETDYKQAAKCQSSSYLLIWFDEKRCGKRRNRFIVECSV